MKIVLFAIIGAILGYMVVVFYNVGFDISLWSQESRFMAIMLMFFGAMGGVVAGTLP